MFLYLQGLQQNAIQGIDTYRFAYFCIRYPNAERSSLYNYIGSLNSMNGISITDNYHLSYSCSRIIITITFLRGYNPRSAICLAIKIVLIPGIIYFYKCVII